MRSVLLNTEIVFSLVSFGFIISRNVSAERSVRDYFSPL